MRPYIFYESNQSETGAFSVTGKNKPLDDLSNLMTNAVGAIKGVGDEVKAMGRSQAEKFIQDMDLVSREEFDVLKARLDAALAEIETLKAAKKPARKTAAKKRPAS
jgi:BMFP domain-containing protein YqiC